MNKNIIALPVVALLGVSLLTACMTDEPASEPTFSAPALGGEMAEAPESIAAPSETPEPEVTESEAPEVGTSEASGTFSDPFEYGYTVSFGDQATVTVTGVNWDATQEVMSENQFNDAPEDGMVYALIEVTVENLAYEEGLNGFLVDASYVQDGVTYDDSASYPVVPNGLIDVTDTYPGASFTANAVAMVPEGTDGTDGMFKVSLLWNDAFVLAK